MSYLRYIDLYKKVIFSLKKKIQSIEKKSVFFYAKKLKDKDKYNSHS